MNLPGDQSPTSSEMNSGDAERELRMRTRRAVISGAVAAGMGYAGWRWLRSRRTDMGIGWPFRKAMDVNEQISRDLFSPTHLAPEFPPSSASPLPRLNGDIGLDEDFNPKKWKLSVWGLNGANGAVDVSMSQIKALPRIEMTTSLNCIEGWSSVTTWAGARFAEFAQQFPPRPDLEYVALETPDGGYFVGLDLASALHPQTLLAYEVGGKPLPPEHGAPLRLVIPTKYGIKNIKRIGTITYTLRRPPDYWAEQGYDWYAGL